MTIFSRSTAALAILLIGAMPAWSGEVTTSGGAAEGAAAPAASAPNPTEAKLLQAPNFALRGIDGKTHELKDYEGKVVLLDFWATWCGPCKMEMPHLKELHNRYSEKGLAIIGVSVDRDGVKAVAPYVEKNQIPFLSLLANAEVVQAYGNVRAIPTTFLIDRKGVIQKVYRGYQDIKVFEADLKKLL